MNQDELADTLRAGIDRFLGEMQPYWMRSYIEKLTGITNIEGNEVVEGALKQLEKEEMIYIVRDDEVYFLISEKYLERVGVDSRLTSYRIQQIKELKSKFKIP